MDDAVDETGAITVVLCARDEQTRTHLRSALERDGFTIVAEPGSAVRALGEVLIHHPAICLLERSLPGDLAETIREIVAQRPGTRIGLLTDSAEAEEVLSAVRAGAEGVLLIGAEDQQLAAAARALAHGQQPLPRAMTSQLVAEWRTPLASTQRKGGPISRALLYVPRLARHFRHRRRAGMSLGASWRSARARMQRYR